MRLDLSWRDRVTRNVRSTEELPPIMAPELSANTRSGRLKFQFTLRSLFVFALYTAVLMAILANGAAHCTYRAVGAIRLHRLCNWWGQESESQKEFNRVCHQLHLKNLRSRRVLELAAEKMARQGLHHTENTQSRVLWLAERIECGPFEFDSQSPRELYFLAAESSDRQEAAAAVNAVLDAYLELLPIIAQTEDASLLELLARDATPEVGEVARAEGFSSVEAMYRAHGLGLAGSVPKHWPAQLAQVTTRYPYGQLAIHLSVWAVAGLILLARGLRRRAACHERPASG